ncbi:hypothetical protein Tco_1261097 [Tanacetum coccineum]
MLKPCPWLNQCHHNPPKQPNEIRNDESEEKEHGKEGSTEDTNTMVHNDEQMDTSQLEPKGATINNLGPNRNDDEIEWLDVEEPLDLVDIRYRMPSDLEDRFYRDTIKLGPEYLTGMEDEGEVTKFFIKNKNFVFTDLGDSVMIYTRRRDHDTCDGFRIIQTASNAQVIFDDKKLGNSKEVSLDDSWMTI